MSSLQRRIEELGSAILNFKENNVYIDGFYNSERLLDYLNGKDCRMSQGLYDYEELDFSRIQDNCLIIIKQNGNEIKRYQYSPFFKGIVKYINTEKKNVSRQFTLRKCLHSNQYNIIIFDEELNKQSIVCANMQDLKQSFENLFLGYKLYGLDNKRITEGFEYVQKHEDNSIVYDRSVLTMNQIVAFDVETPNRCNNRICSMGLTIINNGIITDTFHYLINPETNFDQMCINIHGIKPADVLNALTFPEIWEEIAEFFRASLITAHNATFDLCVLRKTLLAYGIHEPSINYVCTLQMASNIIKDIENYKLPTLASYVGIDLHHHNSQSDSKCCAELFRILLGSAINLDNYIKSFDLALADECRETKTYRSKYLSNQNQSLNTLKDLLSAVICDNILNEQEILFLQNWLDNNKELEGNYPYDKIFSTVSNALADGIIEQNELECMLILFKQISDPVGSQSNKCTSLDIKDKNIVLTGEFDRGDRKSLELELESLGAICNNSVNNKTHYVIVGGQGSSLWSAGNYGNKVKRAMELQEKGIAIEIIRESYFYSALECI